MATILIFDTYCLIEEETDTAFLRGLDRELSYTVQGSHYMRSYKSGYYDKEGKHVIWDGVNRLLSEKLTFPIGLLDRVKEFYSGCERAVTFIDKRSGHTKGRGIDIYPKLEFLGKVPYSYQLDALEVVKNHNRGIIRIATGGGKCKSANSLNLTEFGILEMSEIGANLEPGQSKEMKWEISTPLNKNQKDITSHIYRDGYGPSRLITTESNYWTQDTPAHRLKILSDNGDIEWKYVSEIKKNDILVITKNQKVFGKNTTLSEKDAYNLGLLTGDSLSSDKSIPRIIRESPSNVLAKFIQGLYETDGWVENKKSGPGICIGLSSKKLIDQLHVILLNYGIVAHRRIKKTTHKDCHILSIYREFIPIFEKEIGLNPLGPKYKKLQDVLFAIKDLIKNPNKNLVPFQSKKLRQIKNEINKKYGIKIWKTSPINPATFRSWSDNKCWRNPSKINLKQWLDWAGQLIDSSEINYLNLICSDTFYFDKVSSVEETLTDNYDFVVPDTHSFVSQGFINHNTNLSAMMVAHFGKKTILYVIGKDLLYQTHKLFTSLFDQKIGMIGDGICDIQDINIASVWTVGQALGLKDSDILEDQDQEEEKIVDSQKYKDIRDMLASSKVHIFDECHLAACKTIQEISINICPEHIYGMSASPWRDDNADLLIECVLGRPIIDISASYLIERGFLVKPIIKFVSVPPPAIKLKKSYPNIYKNYIVENDIRNGIVIRGAEKLVEQGYQTLVLFNSIAHGNLLHQEISKHIPCALLSGKDSYDVRERVKKQLENKEINCIIASKIFDIGVDLPSLSGLIVASGGKSSVRALQRIGRVIRKHPGKTQSAVIDFYDQAPFLQDHSKARRKIYLSESKFEVQWPIK